MFYQSSFSFPVVLCQNDKGTRPKSLVWLKQGTRNNFSWRGGCPERWDACPLLWGQLIDLVSCGCLEEILGIGGRYQKSSLEGFISPPCLGSSTAHEQPCPWRWVVSPPLVNRRLSARVDDGNCTKAVIYLNLSKTNSVSVICLSLGKISLPVPDPECCVEHLTKANASEGLPPSPDGSISRAVKQLQHLIISHISFIIRYSKEVTLDFIIRKGRTVFFLCQWLF